jgi:excisionase family DNA binding protein
MHEWLTVKEAAQHAKCGVRSIYLAVQQGKLRAARLGGRRELRFLACWIDGWLLATSTPEIVNPLAPSGAVIDARPSH